MPVLTMRSGFQIVRLARFCLQPPEKVLRFAVEAFGRARDFIVQPLNIQLRSWSIDCLASGLVLPAHEADFVDCFAAGPQDVPAER